MIYKRKKIIFVITTLLFLLQLLLLGSGTKEFVPALRIDDEIVIVVDGKPDEEIWQKSQPTSDFFQFQPAKGSPASFQTEAWVFYNSRNIYFGITCYDSQPQKIVAQVSKREGEVSSDDSIVLLRLI